MSEQRFDELLALFEKYKGVTDEITFFTSATHPPLPIEEIQHRTAILAQRVAQAKKLGYRSGINILSTIGHHNENLPNSLSGNFVRLTDIDGNVCQGAFCPSDPRVQEYVQKLYKAVASAKPDYIWIDDDVRLAGHMPIFLTCFCDHCLAIFEKETGKHWTRPGFKAALQSGSLEDRLALRKAWLKHNRELIGRLFKLIEETVHQATPGMPLGFMTGDRFFEGYDFDTWARILSGPNNAEVRWRPGGGFYEDENIAGLAGKSHDVGRQVSLLPPEITIIQSEIENFPYHRLKKAAHITLLEAASHIASGCTGAAFNVLSGNDEPLGEDEFEPLVAYLHRARPFFDMLVQHLGRKPLAGIHAAWNKDTAAASDLANGNWFSFSSFISDRSTRMFEIGLPIDYSPKGASVTLLSEDNVVAFSKDDILRMLSSGVYMDAAALTRLNQMGYQEYTGFEVERVIPNDCIEKLTEHFLNRPFSNRERDCRQSFNHYAASVFKPSNPKAEVLARLVDYSGQEVAPVSMGIFQNRLGGRICVAGYFPWTFLHSLSKSAQMKSVMRWLSRDQLPAYVGSFHKINLWSRQLQNEAGPLAMTNSSHDTATNVILWMRTDKQQICVVDMDCQRAVIAETGTDGPFRKFVIPKIGPWQMRLVICQ